MFLQRFIKTQGYLYETQGLLIHDIVTMLLMPVGRYHPSLGTWPGKPACRLPYSAVGERDADAKY